MFLCVAQADGGSVDKVAKATNVADGGPAAGVSTKGGASSSCRPWLQAKGVGLPVGMPTGPWQDAESAKAELKAWCMDLKTAGGGWGITWGGVRAASSRRGTERKLVCHLHGGLRVAPCKWRLSLEECVGGWVVSAHVPHSEGCAHSHTLTQSTAEANAHTAMRSIPADLLPQAKSLAAAGIATKSVLTWLKHTVTVRGEEVTFEYMDVYHAVGASTAERALDATNLVEALRQREQEQKLFSRTTNDKDGFLDKVGYSSPPAS